MAALPSTRLSRSHFFCWALLFAGLLLVTRLGNLGREVIDWDESTFIIMASHLRAGQLPYLELFDNKPPGIYFALAGVMTLFGENLLTIRFFGAFCLLVAALAGYGIAVRRSSSLAAGVAMAVFLVLAGAPNFQPTMTEHLVIALMMPACWLLVARRDRLWATFVIGLLLSLATLTRTNIAFVVLALGGFYTWQLWRPSPSVPRLALFAYSAGGLVPLLPLLAVYASVDGLDEFFLGNVLVPLAYSSQGAGLLAAFQSYVDLWERFILRFRPIFLPATILFGITLCVYAAQRRKRVLAGDEGLLLLVFAATSFSILMNGRQFEHHLLQIMPLLAVFASYGLRGPLRNMAFICAGWTIVAGIALFGADSAALARDWSQREARYDLRKIATLIRADGAVDGAVYAPTHHLVYWYLGPGSLPSRLAHPSDIAKEDIVDTLVEHGYIPANEWERIWSSRLGYVVVAPNRLWYFYRRTAPSLR